jgi:N-acetylmuramoyl-L-alanine amidase
MPVFGHREKGSSECPGALFPLERVRNANISSTKTYGWNQDQTGWWYCTDTANNYYYRDCWQSIDGEWYSFDHDGYARHDTWIASGGKWYYLRTNCVMAKSQWLWLDGECYCFGPDGALYMNCTTPDGYQVDDSGAWIH